MTARVRVLVVDDDAEIGDALRAHLEDDTTELRHVGSGEDALAALERESFDIAIVDHVMPGMDGLSVLEAIRLRWPAVMRVLYTAYPGADVVLDAVNRGGVHKALAKSMHPESVLAEVRELITQRLAQIPS